jgi:hypothetical protein
MPEEITYPFEWMPLAVGGIEVVGWDGYSYVDRAGRTYWSGESPSEADALAAVGTPRAIPAPAAEQPPVGTRRSLVGSFQHSEISTSAGGTFFGVIPAGWAMEDFQANVETAFDSGRTISLGTAASPNRWVNGLAVSTVGFKQATPLQRTPQSAAAGTNVYIRKSATTTVGDIINVSVIIERKY